MVIYGLGTIGLLLTMLLVEKGIQNLFIIGNKDIQKKQALKMGIPESCYCDSRQQSIEGWVLSHTEGAGADVLYECVGKSENIVQTIDLAAPGGRIPVRTFCWIRISIGRYCAASLPLRAHGIRLLQEI